MSYRHLGNNARQDKPSYIRKCGHAGLVGGQDSLTNIGLFFPWGLIGERHQRAKHKHRDHGLEGARRVFPKRKLRATISSILGVLVEENINYHCIRDHHRSPSRDEKQTLLDGCAHSAQILSDTRVQARWRQTCRTAASASKGKAMPPSGLHTSIRGRQSRLCNLIRSACHDKMDVERLGFERNFHAKAKATGNGRQKRRGESAAHLPEGFRSLLFEVLVLLTSSIQARPQLVRLVGCMKGVDVPDKKRKRGTQGKSR